MQSLRRTTIGWKSAALAAGVVLLALTFATPSGAAPLSKASAKKAGVFTAKSLKCMGSAPAVTHAVFGRCHPKLTLAAVHTFAVAAINEFAPDALFPSYDTTIPYGDTGTDHYIQQVSFVSVDPCRRDFPGLPGANAGGGDGCPVISRRVYSHTVNNGEGHVSSDSGCFIESRNVLAIAPQPAGTFPGAGELSEDFVVLRVSKPKRFQVGVNAFGGGEEGSHPC